MNLTFSLTSDYIEFYKDVNYVSFESINKNKKIVYVELLRIIAIFFVIFNHTNQRGFVHFTLYEIGSFEYWFYMFFSLIAGISIPVFFMISGMLLLDKKDESIGYIWKHRIPKYVFVLLFFSFFQYLIINRFDVHAFSLKEYFLLTYTSGVIMPYWYLYVYIAFLIALPFIRKMARDINEHEFLYLVGFYILFNGIICILQYVLSNGTVYINEYLSPAVLFHNIVFYPLIGYYLGNKIKTVNTKKLLVCFFLFLISVLLTAYITDYKIKLTGDLGEGDVITFYRSTRPLQAIFIFLFVRKAFENKKLPGIVEKVILSIGKCTFGIYLIEDTLRESLNFIYVYLSSKVDCFPAILLFVFVVFCIGFFIIYLCKYIDLIFIRLYSIFFKKKETQFK